MGMQLATAMVAKMSHDTGHHTSTCVSTTQVSVTKSWPISSSPLEVIQLLMSAAHGDNLDLKSGIFKFNVT